MLCTFPLLLFYQEEPDQQYLFVAPYQILVHCCVTARYHSLSRTLQPQPTLALWSLLCVELQSFSYMRASMCVSDGLWWFWMVSSEHPCVYSSTKVSKAVTALCFSCFYSPAINHPLLSVSPSFNHPYAFL